MSYCLVIFTFSPSHKGSPFYETLMVEVRFHSLLFIPKELSQQIQSGIALSTSLHALFILTMTCKLQDLESFLFGTDGACLLQLTLNDRYSAPAISHN